MLLRNRRSSGPSNTKLKVNPSWWWLAITSCRGRWICSLSRWIGPLRRGRVCPLSRGRRWISPLNRGSRVAPWIRRLIGCLLLWRWLIRSGSRLQNRSWIITTIGSSWRWSRGCVV